MFNRTAKIDFIRVNAVGSSSILQIGDSTIINSLTHAIAVQREKELFFSNEADFQSFDVFRREAPMTPFDEDISFRTSSIQPYIKVGKIDIIATSSAVVVHIGNIDHIQAEARIKHIRQIESLQDETKENNTKEE